MKYRILLRVLLFTLLCSSCSDEITVSKNLDETPPIFPDYRDVTIPPNIAPLNFGLLSEEIGNAYAFFHYKDIDFKVKLGGNRTFQIPSSEWKELLQQAQGDSITIAVYIKKDNE